MESLNKFVFDEIVSCENLRFTYAGPNAAGKYCGLITQGPEKYCRKVLNTEAVYDTPDDAAEAVKEVAIQCKSKNCN